MGARPRFVAVARDRHVGPARWPSRVDLVVLPASSAARALYAGAPAHVRQAPAVAMGAQTVEAARRCGALRVACAERDTVDDLVLAAVRAASAPRPGAASATAPVLSPEVTP